MSVDNFVRVEMKVCELCGKNFCRRVDLPLKECNACRGKLQRMGEEKKYVPTPKLDRWANRAYSQRFLLASARLSIVQGGPIQ